jgi:hypothetical protein
MFLGLPLPDGAGSLQGSGRLLPNQAKQPFLMLLQRRPALTLVGFGLKVAGPAQRIAVASPITNYLAPLAPPRHPQQPGSPELADRSNNPVAASSA